MSIVIVSDSTQAAAAKAILGENFTVVDWSVGLDPIQVEKKQVIIWLNKKEGYREDVDAVGKLTFHRALSVCELTNQEEGIGVSPAEALEKQMDLTTFLSWKESHLREVTQTTFRHATATKVRGGFLKEIPDFRVAWAELALVPTSHKNNQPVPNVDNVLRILQSLEGLKGAFWLDEFSGAPMFARGKKSDHWTDGDTAFLWVELQRHLGMYNLTEKTVHSAMMMACSYNARHPVKEWIDPIKWDETPRVEFFLRDCLGATDTAFNRAVSKNILIGMIARIYTPGCKMDNMVVLEGPQGAFKSTAVRTLVGNEWFAECNEPLGSASKDFFAILHAKMAVEIAEMSSFSSADAEKIKTTISIQTDLYRAPYGRIPQHYPRSSIFFGTTNNSEYLTDPTGGRRFWPVRVGRIDIKRIERERDQLFAEAKLLWSIGTLWHDVPQDEALAAQEARRSADPWEETIQHYLVGRSSTTTGEVLDKCLFIPSDRQTTGLARRLAGCMRSIGFEHRSIRSGKCVDRTWVRLTSVTDEVGKVTDRVTDVTN